MNKMLKLWRGKLNRLNPRVRICVLVVSILIVLLILLFGWFGTSMWRAGGKIITNSSGGSVLFHKKSEDVKPAELQGEGDGRINIAIYGRGGDGHPGGNLADVIKVLSIDPQNNKMALLSIPRDLWVKVPGYSYSKINASYAEGERIKKGNGPDVANQTISQLLDLPKIHYYISLDFEALKKLVDAFGGITVTVEKQLDDPFYPAPNMINYAPLHIKAGTQIMNGDLALKYSRSRETTSDFDRARRQEIVMTAIKDKAFTAGILANPLKISEIIGILGDHVRTNLKINEMRQLITLVKESDANLISKVLDTAADGPLMGVTDTRGYVIVPRDGDLTYKEVKRIAHEIFTDPFLAKEKSTIEIQNATGKNGLGNTVSNLLKSYGYNVVKVTTSNTKEPFTELIDYSKGKNPFTASFLEKRFNLKSRYSERPENITTDFVIMIGGDYETIVSARESKNVGPSIQNR